MKRKKKQGGFTLVELIVAISLLAILSAGIISLIYTSRQNYQQNQKKQEDEHNARNALVFITREIHSDTYVMEPVPPDYNRLILKKYDKDDVLEREIEFSLDSEGYLQRLPVDYNDTPFAANKLKLEKFEARPSKDKDGNEDGRRVDLYIKCEGESGLELETSVALLRTQQPL